MELSQRARVRAGDHDEFGLLFEEHARAVYNHAFRLTGNWSAAEEVVSLTFLEAWRLRSTVRPEGGSLLPWLLGIALNVARNVSRAARRQQAAMNRLPKAQDVPDFADDLAGRLDDAERLEKIHAALNGLRRTERDVLALCVWSGQNYAEAAEALGVPVGTVRGDAHQPAHPATAAQLLARIHVDQHLGQAGLQERVDLRQDHPAVHRRTDL